MGYGIVTILLLLQIRSFIYLLTGTIFFFGALFVYFVVKTGVLTLKDLLATQMRQLELQRSKETAEAIAKAKSDFLAVMSHEIRTPMNAVIGMSQLLLDTPLEPQQKELAQIIYTSGDALLAIINDILDFSKLESGKIKLKTQPFNLRDCIQEVFEIVAQDARHKNLNLSYSIDPNIAPLIQSNIIRLKQILINLINNAIKFTAHGDISVNIQKAEESMLLFSIQDTGIGIPPEYLDKLFKPFSQVDSSTTRKHDGTGLGLAICQKLTELLGGRIWVESTIDQGTTFFFTIKVSPESILPPPELSRLDSADKNFATKFPANFLIAEDNAVNQKLMKFMFQKLGYQVDLVGNGLAVLEKVETCGTDHYDLIFMDIHMPKMDGLAATRHLRQRFNTRHCPIIVAITASAFLEDQDACLKAGMDDFISKPIRLEKLQMIIAKWMASS